MDSIEWIFFWMNIPDFVLNWILNWIIFRPDSMKKWIFKTDRPGLGGKARKEEQHWSGENNDAENDMMTVVVLIVVLMLMRMMLQVCRMRSNGTNKKVEQSSWNGPHRVCKRNIESICIGVGEEWGCKEQDDLDLDDGRW